MHSTNYYNSLITVAPDCKATYGIAPKENPDKLSIANYHFFLINQHAGEWDSDELIFQTYARRNDLLPTEYASAKAQFFAKGQACLLCSPLCKTHGWGIYSDAQGKITLIDSASEAYEKMLQDESIKKIPAMRSSKK